MSLDNYKQKKEQLQKDFLAAKKEGNVALNKKTSNLFRHRSQENTKKINVRDFNNVILIDEENLTAEVEGMTPYEALVEETLKYGLMPTVVPQLKSITIGGAYTGVGIEASSFKYGLVHETIEEFDIMLGNGEVITCDKNTCSDLFYGFPNSYGTFGYALKIKVKLVPIKKYVKLTHLHFNNSQDYFSTLAELCNKKQADFIDGTIFSDKEMYITLGTFVDQAPEVSDYTYMDIYFRSIQNKTEDYLSAHDYIWRWDTDWFWCSKHYGVQNPLIRKFWGKKRLNSIVYSKIRHLNNKLPFNFSSGESVVQDVEIPIENCVEFMEFFHKEIGIKPVWICPLETYNTEVDFNLYPMNKNKLYVNFGFWDIIKSDKEDGYYNKLIENKVRELNGKKSLYSTAYYSEEEFWQLYNKPAYNALKAKYDPEKAFKDLFQKVVLRK